MYVHFACWEIIASVSTGVVKQCVAFGACNPYILVVTNRYVCLPAIQTMHSLSVGMDYPLCATIHTVAEVYLADSFPSYV